MLAVPAVETSATGRPILAPGEVEHMLINSVDVSINSDRSPDRQHKDGRAIVTSHRLLWLPSAATSGQPSGMAFLLTTLHRVDLRASASSFFTVQKLHMVVLCDTSGVPLQCGSNPPAQQLPMEIKVTLICRDKGSHVNGFYTRLLHLQREAMETLQQQPSAAPFFQTSTQAPLPGPLASGALSTTHSITSATHLVTSSSSSTTLQGGPSLQGAPSLQGGPSTTRSTTEHDAVLAQLLGMGFGQHRAAHAALVNASVDAALEWLLARDDDPLLDLPPTTQRYGSGGGGGGAGVAGILQREQLKAAATDR